MIDPKVARLLGQGMDLISRVPPSLLSGVIETLKAIVAGRGTQAERLARNTALAFAAKKAASERIKRIRR